MAVRGCGRKRLVKAAGSVKAFMHIYLVRWPGVFCSYAITPSPFSDGYRRCHTLGRDVVLKSFPYFPAGCGHCSGCCGSALFVAGMKHVVDSGLASSRRLSLPVPLLIPFHLL